MLHDRSRKIFFLTNTLLTILAWSSSDFRKENTKYKYNSNKFGYSIRIALKSVSPP